jgi:hypothetical protein
LLIAIRLGVPRASEFFATYGIYTLVLLPAFFVFAVSKTYSEFRHRPRYLSLIANEQQSAWGQTKQPNGNTHTQISIRFQATNQSSGSIHLPMFDYHGPG